MFRHTLLLLAIIAATPAMAGTRDDVYSASQRCAAITDDRIWLNCYYGAAQPMRGQLQLPPAPASQTSLIPPPGTVLPGQQQAVRAAPQRLTTLDKAIGYLAGGDVIVSHASIKSYEISKQGVFTVVLMNGQVWKQSDDQTRSIKWHNPVEAHQVSIWKGSLNTFNLGFDDESDRYKVRLLK